MSHFITIEPRDPMMVRDGRAMNGYLGRSVLIPPPSTIAGLVRTQLGYDTHGIFDKRRIPSLLENVSVWGPLIAKLSSDGARVDDVFFAAPEDCVWFKNSNGELFGRALRPMRVADIDEGATTDLDPSSEGTPERLPSFEVRKDLDTKAKPTRGKPLWSLASIIEWLREPKDPLAHDSIVGIGMPERELRTHVSIDASTGTADDGALFGTEGVRYLLASRDDNGRKRFDRLALLARYAGPSKIPSSFATLGGERRGAFIEHRSDDVEPKLAPPSWLEELRRGSMVRVLLATPAIFKDGAVPREILGAKVLCAKVDRPQVISGWSFEHNRPKPTRRMAPAGSVYWVECPSDEWAVNTWLANVSDNAQDRRDGFGLALVGKA